MPDAPVIYAFGGLGADSRVFSPLQLKSELIFVDWIRPCKNETIKSYALRISEIIDTSIPFILLGVSFGGLIAVELSKIHSPELTILISSAATRKDLNVIYRWIGKSRLQNIVPAFVFVPPLWLASRLFRAKNPKVLASILDDTDPKFAKWAIGALLSWDNEEEPEKLFRIHGERDLLLPSPDDSRCVLFPDSGHFMIVDEAAEISAILNKIISSTEIKTR